jgi:hypothetical protein
MTKTTARAIADRYFKMQCERLGPIDHKLYNQAADIVINEMLAEAGVKPAKAKRSMKANRAFIEAHEANHAEMQARIAKDRAEGLAIEAAVAREDLKQLEETGVWVKPRSLEDIYAVLKGEK